MLYVSKPMVREVKPYKQMHIVNADCNLLYLNADE